MAENANLKLFKATERKSRVQVVIDTFKSLLLTKQLRPGDRIPNEFELTKSLNTSRGSVREAMKILSSFGVVEIKPGDGTYISRSMSNHLFDHLIFQMILSDTDKRQLRELRQMIEEGIVKLVIDNATDEDLDEIERRNRAMREKVESNDLDPDTLTQLDIAFHLAIGKASRNILVERIYDFTLELFAPSIRKTHEQPDKGINAVKYHQLLIERLKARDYDRAVAAVKESIGQWVSHNP